MKKVTKLSLNILAVGVVALSMSGCSALQETMASQMEVPTLEKQVNRVAIGMTIVRENNIMAYKMPISADAKWPALVAADLDDAHKAEIKSKIMYGPYLSTVKYTDSIQRKALGSGALVSMLGASGATLAKALDSKISPMTYRAVQKIEIFYGKNEKNWPNIFGFDNSLENFLDFKDAKMINIDSPTGDVYNTLGEAVIALAPVNLQKDLSAARVAMIEAFEVTAGLKSEQAGLETELETNKTMTDKDKLENKKQITMLETRVDEAESLADEKESIYFELIEGAVLALESEINLDDENYVKLAQNLNIAADQIQVGAAEAGTSFALALTNIIANNMLLKIPTELESLKQAEAQIPKNLKAKYAKRMERLGKNFLYVLPNLAIGSYYAAKQASVAGKYKDITEVILTANAAKLEQEKEAAKAAKEAESEKVATK